MTDKHIPAFPAMHFDLAVGEHGMTLRDYFAAKTIEALINWGTYNRVYEPSLFAQEAYAIADAMLEARIND